MNSDHLFPLLDSERDSMKFYEFASLLARGEVPGEVMEILRMGCITALSKPDGGVLGITVGDILRRLVSRTVAQQYSKRVEIATALFQYALSTRVGCECIAHVIQTLTGINEEATVVSIDGVGVFDLISRNAMLQAFLEIDGGDQIMPFVRQFYGRPSTHLWEDEMGEVHEIAQGEGGEQGDPLMPLLFSLGQHAALAAANARLEGGERLFAYLDDIYVICSPRRVLEVHRVLQEELWAHARIRIHHGKTQLWNQGGSEPAGVVELTVAARLVEPDAVVWKSDPEFPLSQNGLRVLGAPIGHPLYIVDQLASKSAEHELLFQRIPSKRRGCCCHSVEEHAPISGCA